MEINFSKYPYPDKIRHHASSNIYFPINNLRVIPQHYPPLISSINYADIFLNGKVPNVLDVGCGKSKFLLNYAFQNPNDNILGFEVRKKLVDWLNNLVLGEQIPNANALWYTCVNGFDFLAENSIDKIFYLFPDPWPKQSQHNRRLFSLTFLNDIFRILKPTGKLFLATDCDYVDEFHKKTLEKSSQFDFHYSSIEEWTFPVTNKEDFCLKKQIPTYKIVASPKK
jgi:tRNA (guanine-N7-)-methyltransferase